MMYQTMINVYISVNDLIPFTVDFNSLISTTENRKRKTVLDSNFLCFRFETFFFICLFVGSSCMYPHFTIIRTKIQIVMLRSLLLFSTIKYQQQQVFFIPKRMKRKKNIQIWRETKKNYLLYLKLNIKRQMIKICWKSEDFFWWNLRTETSPIGVCLRIEKLIRTETIYEMKLDSACLHSTAWLQ